MNERVNEVLERMERGLVCSQAVLVTYGPLLGLDEAAAVRIARGFGTGMARLCATCGAVTGAFMVLGLKEQGEGRTAKEETYAQVRKFAAAFEAANGALTCRELLGCDLDTQQGRDDFRQRGMAKSHCRKFVRDASEILETML